MRVQKIKTLIILPKYSGSKQGWKNKWLNFSPLNITIYAFHLGVLSFSSGLRHIYEQQNKSRRLIKQGGVSVMLKLIPQMQSGIRENKVIKEKILLLS